MRAVLHLITRPVSRVRVTRSLFSVTRTAPSPHCALGTRQSSSVTQSTPLRTCIRSALYSTEDKKYKNTFEEDPHSFHEVVDATLQHLLEQCEQLDARDIEGFDCVEHDGVFELKLGSLGTFVINKQTPNRQLWFSSPISGPKRYNYDMETKTWRNTRDGHNMFVLLSDELARLLGFEFKLKAQQ